MNQPVAPSSGFPGNQVRNLGEVSNHGIEFSGTLQAIARRNFAWDVSGNQVVLRSSGGDTVATLNNAGGTRYEGTTTGGQPISLFR